MKHTTRSARYRWNKQRPAQIRQFLLRLFPLLLIIVSSSLLVWIYRYSDLRQDLDENAFELASTRTVESVDDYFNPLIDIIFSSVLWGSIGEIDSIGNPEDYMDLLQTRIRSLGSVSSLSLTDADYKELVMTYPHEDSSDWYVTEETHDRSLTSKRASSGISYLSNDSGQTENSFESTSEPGLRISSEYTLPVSEEQGITLTLLPSSQYGNREVNLSIDLSFNLMAERLKEGGAVEGTLIFLLMPSGEDHLFLPLDDLLALSESNGEILPSSTPLDDSANELIAQLEQKITEAKTDKILFRFETSENEWLTEFHQIGFGTDSLMIGTLVPAESLWTFRFSIPLQVVLLMIFGASIFLGYRLIIDFREVTRSVDRIEEMLTKEIAQGESANLEFKSSLRWDYREDEFNKNLEDVIVKSIAAFNNAQGGTLLIGVADDGKILGIEKDYAVLKQPGKDYYEIHLRNLFGAKYGIGYTSKALTIDFPRLSDKEICRIRIRRGRQPLFTTLKAKSGGPVEKFYIRSGNTSQVLDHPSEITNYILTRFSRWRMGKSLTES